MNKWVSISLGLGIFSVVGCSIEIQEGQGKWNDWEEESTVAERATDACQPYCLRLIACGVLSDSSLSACTDLCEQRYIEDEETVAEGCECISESACESDEVEECSGDPIPDVWTDGDDAMDGGDDDDSDDSDDSGDSGDGTGGGTSSGGATSGDGTSGDETAMCAVNHECRAGEDCIDSQCLTRCAASCQCAEGEACEDGYCRIPEAPAAECEDTCDCTAGDVCVDGSCQ